MLAVGARRLSESFQNGRFPLGTLAAGSGRTSGRLFDDEHAAVPSAVASKMNFRTTRTVWPSMDARSSDHRIHAGPASLRWPPGRGKTGHPNELANRMGLPRTDPDCPAFLSGRTESTFRLRNHARLLNFVKPNRRETGVRKWNRDQTIPIGFRTRTT